MKQSDERKIVFARLSYKDGSERNKDFYDRYPERKELDDYFRTRPVHGEEGIRFFHKQYTNIVEANFKLLADIRQFSDGEPAEEKIQGSAEDFTKHIKGLMGYYGAKLVGIVKMTPELYYSHHGRPPEKYGKEVMEDYPYAVVFAYEMIEEMFFCAPRLPAAIAATQGYMDAAVGGLQLCYYLRSLGYRARNNMDGYYLMPLVPLAVEAGIGEIGANGLMLTEKYGSRLRLGAVLTDIPLIPDEPLKPKLSKFCEICMRCAKVCPGRAILSKDEGYFSDDKCFSTWLKFGTDCGTCVTACPFSNHIPEEIIEKLVDEKGLFELTQYCENNKQKAYLKEDPEWMR